MACEGLPHGAEYHDRVSAGFKLFPVGCRISTRQNLDFGIVAERVPTDALRDAKFWPNTASTAASWTGENPVIWRSILRMLAPFSQCFCQVRIKRNWLL